MIKPVRTHLHQGRGERIRDARAACALTAMHTDGAAAAAFQRVQLRRCAVAVLRVLQRRHLLHLRKYQPAHARWRPPLICNILRRRTCQDAQVPPKALADAYRRKGLTVMIEAYPTPAIYYCFRHTP